jgi:hypothetical protein
MSWKSKITIAESTVKECNVKDSNVNDISTENGNAGDPFENPYKPALGLTLILLAISFLANIIQCIISMKRTTQATRVTNEPGVPFYCTYKDGVREFDFGPDGDVNIYDTVPTKSN